MPDLPTDVSDSPDSMWCALGELLRLAVPMVIASASSTIMHFVDARMVSALGKTQLAAVSASGVVVFALVALASGAAGCVNTFASQSMGRGRPRDSSAYAWQNFFFALGVGVIALAAIPFAPRLFAVFGHAPELQAAEVVYGRIRIAGLGFMVAIWGFCSYFQGIHRPWISTGTTIVANVFNLAADYALIFGHWGFPRLGIAGAAWGTFAALLFQVVLLAAFVVHPAQAREFGGWENMRFDWPKLKQLLHIGWPAGLNFFLDIASWAVFTNFFIGKFGEAAIAGNAVAMQFMHLSFMPAMGLGGATAALVGKYRGQGDIARAKDRAYLAIRLALGYMLTMGVLFSLLRYRLAQWFSPGEPDVIEQAAVILVFAAIF